MAVKRHNSLVMDYDLDGLPRDWRRRVEDTVRSVGGLYHLYVTSAKAGARKTPPGILLSVAREGAEDAWTAKVEAVLIARIRAALDFAKEEEKAQQKARARLELGVAGADLLAGKIPARETRVPRDPSERAARAAKRTVLTRELVSSLSKAALPAEARDLVDAAAARMRTPETWALWVRILLEVEEIDEAIPPTLHERILKLL